MSTQMKLQELQDLRTQIDKLTYHAEQKEKLLAQKESSLRQGQLPQNSVRDLEINMARNLGMLAPGNVGDLNKVIWPYYFTTEIPTEPIGNAETLQTGFQVTQEASFILMSYVKTVYLANQSPWEYLDPNNYDNLTTRAPGLSYTLRDGTSTRQFFNSIPPSMGQSGNPLFPSKLPRPILLLPNQKIEVNFINRHVSNLYVPSMTFFGYRIRSEHAKEIMSLVYG